MRFPGPTGEGGSAARRWRRSSPSTQPRSSRATASTRLVVALDGLDGLADPEGADASILDFLPAASELPERCHVVLTSPGVAAVCRQGDRAPQGRRGWAEVLAGVASAENRDLLRRYLAERLPEPFRSPGAGRGGAGSVGRRVPLRLPPVPGGWSPARSPTRTSCRRAASSTRRTWQGGCRRGPATNSSSRVYEPTLLLLAAAYRPVTLGQLELLGMPGDRLRFAAHRPGGLPPPPPDEELARESQRRTRGRPLRDRPRGVRPLRPLRINREVPRRPRPHREVRLRPPHRAMGSARRDRGR